MAPSARQLEEALIEAATSLFKTDPDNVTVNKVRKDAAESLSIDQDFFTSAQWKGRSKDLIKGYVTQLHEGVVPEPKEPKDTKSANKRRPSVQSPEELSPEPKRRKQAVKPRPKPKKEESDDGGLGDEEEYAPKAKAKGKAKVKKIDSDEEADTPKVKRARKPKARDSDEDEEEKKTKKQVKRKGGALDPESDSEGEAMKLIPVRKHEKSVKDETKGEGSSGEQDKKPKNSIDSGEEEPKNAKEESLDAEDKPAAKEEMPPVDEEEEYSDVIDEPPKPKRVKKEKDEKKEKTRKSSTSKKSSAAPAPDDPNEAEIKKLQHQLTRCGIRKLWHNELKQHGSDPKAKIRHLRKMLTDVGMTGRFSEARAKEIKEERELLADVEEAQKMNQLWGLASEGRASRSKAKKNLREDSEDEDDTKNKYNGDGDDEDTVFAARRRAQADLAFLGDESESD